MTRLPRLVVAPVAVFVVFAALANVVFAQAPSPGQIMAEANVRHQRGEYAEAAQEYEALIGRGYRDPAVHYNLGNTYLSAGDPGRAILNYLRAEELSPRDPDIQSNLELARGQTVDRMEAERDSLVESVSYLGRRLITPGELGVVSLSLWGASALTIGILLVWRTVPLRPVLRIGATIGPAATLVSFLLLLSMVYANPYHSTGVVTGNAVEVLSGPGPQYPEEFTLHSGAQVRLTGSSDGWLQVALPGGELRGWAPAHAIEAVAREDHG